MNSIARLGQAKVLQAVMKTNALQPVRTAFVITEDWLPGKRPETEEEKLKAAKKYNMFPEEYEAQPDDGFATGDYPHIAGSHHDDRDPFYPWDYPVFRLNYGEPIPENFFTTQAYHYNWNNPVNQQVPVMKQIAMMTATLGSFILLIYILAVKYKYYEPRFDPPMYKKGVTHFGYH